MGKVVKEKMLSPDWRKRVQIEYTRLKQQKKFRHQVQSSDRVHQTYTRKKFRHQVQSSDRVHQT